MPGGALSSSELCQGAEVFPVDELLDSAEGCLDRVLGLQSDQICSASPSADYIIHVLKLLLSFCIPLKMRLCCSRRVGESSLGHKDATSVC